MDINFNDNRRSRRSDSKTRGEKGGKPKKLVILIPIIAVLVIGIVIGVITVVNGMSDAGDPLTPHIYVSKTPDDINYVVGEDLDTTGLIVHYMQADGNIVTVPLSECTFEGFDSNLPAESLKVNVIYQDMTTYFTVNIKPQPTVSKTLVGIRYDNPKTEYFVGDTLSLEGTLYRLYSDGSEDKISLEPSQFVVFDTSTAGEGILVKMKYKHLASGQIFYYEYTINVKEA